MRIDPGVAISTAAHVAILAWLTVSLPAPDSFKTAPVDALPVDLVPIGDVTNIHKGSKTAPKSEAPQASPIETKHRDRAGENVGNAATDQDTPPTPEDAKAPVTPAADEPPPPPPSKEPEPPTPKPPEPPKPPAPTPPEPKAEPAPPQERAAEEVPQEETPDAPAPTPKPVVPQTKPTPPKPAAEPPKPTPKSDTKAKQTADKQNTKPSDKAFTDDISALLNKTKPAGGGTASSKDPVALGSPKGKGKGTLTQTELDALRAQIAQCWNPPVGATDADDLKVVLQLQLAPDGTVMGSPQILNSGSSPFFRAAAESARRAVMRCQPYKLPAEKYDIWRDVKVNFDPREMLGG